MKKNIWIIVLILGIIACFVYYQYQQKQTQIAIEEQQLQMDAMNAEKERANSIAAAKAEAERIEAERIRQKLLEEDKQRKLMDAKTTVSSLTDALADKVSHYSMQDVSYAIDDNSISYDTDTKTLQAEFESSWMAYTHGALIDNYKEQHVLRGRITVYDNGEIRTETISRNSTLTDAINANRTLADVGDILNEIRKYSKNDNNVE
jgi:hypothetical protein